MIPIFFENRLASTAVVLFLLFFHLSLLNLLCFVLKTKRQKKSKFSKIKLSGFVSLYLPIWVVLRTKVSNSNYSQTEIDSCRIQRIRSGSDSAQFVSQNYQNRM